MATTASKIIKQAQSWIGKKEADGSFKMIVDTYNAHKPLARSYAVKYTDHWCATFISALFIKCGATDIMPTECGCEPMINLCKNKGIWVENENRIPNVGDIVFYDWGDGADYKATDNKGWSDHVGVVESVNGNKFTIIEGNMSEKVGRRTLEVNARYLRGFAVPKYTKEATVTATPTISASTYKVLKTLNGYINAANTKAKKNAVTKVSAGTYYIFNEADGMINVTKKKGTPGAWINPKDNVVAAKSTIKVGDMVGVKAGAKDYNGKKAGGVKRGVICYRVDELRGRRAVLDKKGICTPFHVDNLFK